MPQIVPAVAAAVSWVSSAAAAASAAVVGWMAAPFAMALGEGAAIAMASGVLKVAATALGSYALNAVLAPKVGGGGSPTQFKADPQSPIRGVMGRFGTSGTQAHMRVWGKNNLMISYMVILSLGPIQGVEKFTANGLQVNFTGPNGLAANVEPYKDKMWMTYKNGLPTDGSLMPPPTGGTPTMEWTGNHKTSGYAGALWTMQNNSKRASYEGGVPKPVWTLNGMLCYDPRLDSTQTEIGGSGPHRVDDWRTWTYSQNPQIHAINWALGHYKKLPAGIIDRNFLLAGIGAPITSLHLPSLVAGANVSDANGWKICGEWNTQDDKWNTFAAMLQAGGSAPIHVGAKIGIMTNAPRVPVATITDEDVTGNLNIKVMAPSRDRFNTIYPMYISEPNGWEYATAGAVTSTVYQAEDGGEERSKEMKYNFVGQSKQARELAAYDLANTRETMKLAFPAKPYLIGVRAGDAVNVDMPRRGIVGKFIVLARPLELGEGAISFELRSESDAKHAWALGQTDQPAPSPSLSPFDPSPAPPEGWVVTPRPPESGGTQQPGFIVVGEVPDGIGSVLFEVGSSTSGPWRQVYSGPPTTERVNIDNLAPLETYWVRVTYYSIDGVPSEPTVYGPYTAPDFVAKGEVTFPDGTSPIWNFDELSDLPVPPSSENQTQAYVAETGKLYSWNPDTNAWEPMVADATIDDGTLTNAKFVSGLRAAGLGSALPALPNSAWPVGSQFVLTTDGKTYTNKGGVWKADILADQITGAIQDAQLAGINASKLIGSVVEGQIAEGAITATKLSNEAVTNAKIAAGITASKISGALTNANLPAGSVTGTLTSTQIADSAITADKVANSAITNAKIASGITASKISGALTNANIAAGAITGTITSTQIGDSAITTPKLATNSVSSDKIIANAITAGKIAAGAIEANHISADAVESQHVKAGSITASKVVLGDTSNMVPDGLIVDPAAWIYSSATVSIVTASPDSTSKNRFNVLPDTSDVNVYSQWVPVEQGTNIFFSAVMGYGSGTIGGGSYTYLQTGQDNGLGSVTNIANNTPTTVQTSADRATFSQSIVVPVGANVARLRFRRVTGGTATALFDSPIMRRMASGELIVDGAIIADKIASNAIVSDKIAANAITTDKIAANAVTAGKILAGSINANHISTDAIESRHVAANSITASKIFIGDTSNMFPDPELYDTAIWSGDAVTQGLLEQTGTTVSEGSRYLVGINADTVARGAFSTYMTVEPNVPYMFSIATSFQGGTESSGGWVVVDWYSRNASGALTLLQSDSITGTVTSGTPTRYTKIFTAPSGARTMRIRVGRNAGGTRRFNIYGPVIRRAANAELIVDGAITADKVAANAITAAKIAAGAIDATHIAARSITASKLYIGDTSNALPDADFADLGVWSLGTVGDIIPNPTNDSANRLAITSTTAENIYGQPFTVDEGAVYLVSSGMQFGSGTNTTGYLYLNVGRLSTNGTFSSVSQLLVNSAGFTSSTRSNVSGSVTIPAGVNAARIRFRRVAGGSAPLWFDSPVIRRMAGAELIVNGAITTDKLAANAITAGTIAAGAINGTHISAGAISTSKLAVGDYSNLVNDNFTDLVAWSNQGTGGAIYQTISANGGKTSWRWSTDRTGLAAYGFVGDTSSAHFSVVGGADYYAEATVRMVASCRGRHQIYFMWYDSSGTNISSPVVGQVDSTTSEQIVKLSGIRKAPDNAVTGRLRMRVAADSSGNYTFGGYFYDLVARRAASGELIVDGAITADKISTNAVTADKIVAGAVTSAKINVTELSAITSNLGAITAGSMNINNRFIVNSAGVVTIQSGTSGQRLVISNDLVRIYDSSNTLRLRMGLW